MPDKADETKGKKLRPSDIAGLENTLSVVGSIRNNIEKVEKEIGVIISLSKEIEQNPSLLDTIKKDPVKILMERGLPELDAVDAAMDISPEAVREYLSREHVGGDTEMECSFTCKHTCRWTSSAALEA